MFEKDFFDWVESHKNENPTKLRFQCHGKNNPWWTDIAINHIESINKARKKLADRTGNPDLLPEVIPSKLSIEQTTSAEVAKLHARIFKENIPLPATVLDMTCGLGTDSKALVLEGYSVTACDINPENTSVAKFNFRNFSRFKILERDSIEFLRSIPHVDAIMIDPARRNEKGERIFNIGECSPDMNEVISIAKNITDFMLVKLSPMLDIKQTLIDLRYASKLHVVGENNECKEISAELDFRITDAIPISQIPIALHSQPWLTDLEYTFSDETECHPIKYRLPQINDFIYFPDNVLSKAGCFKLISNNYNLYGIAPNTHLFLSEDNIENWPGKIEKIIDIIAWKSSNIKNLHFKYPIAEVTVRNFGMSADELSRKLKVKQGIGAVHISGITDETGSRLLVISEM